MSAEPIAYADVNHEAALLGGGPIHGAEGAGALTPGQTLLAVEVTSESNGDTDRVIKRKRYAHYGAPLYLLADRQNRTCTLFSDPHDLGYAVVDGPHPFGTPIRLPEPFSLLPDTESF